MAYWVDCSCGERIRVDDSQAGTQVLCRCGASVEVPRLSVLRQQEAEGFASPTLRPAPGLLTGPMSDPTDGSLRRLPRAYLLVAGLFILSGLAWFVGAANDFFAVIAILSGIVCLVTGVGLLLRIHAIWTFALFLVWLEVIDLLILIAIESLVFFQVADFLRLGIALAILGVKLGLNIWAYRVLIREDVCACYYQTQGTGMQA